MTLLFPSSLRPTFRAVMASSRALRRASISSTWRLIPTDTAVGPRPIEMHDTAVPIKPPSHFQSSHGLIKGLAQGFHLFHMATDPHRHRKANHLLSQALYLFGDPIQTLPVHSERTREKTYDVIRFQADQ